MGARGPAARDASAPAGRRTRWTPRARSSTPSARGRAPEHPAARFVHELRRLHRRGTSCTPSTRCPGWGTRVTAPLARFFGGATIVVFDGLSHTVTIAAEDAADVERARAHLESALRRLAPLALPDRTKLPADVQVDIDDAPVPARWCGARRSTSRRATRSRSSWRAQFTVPRAGRDPFDAYRAMRVLNPSPYMYFLDLAARPRRADAHADRRREPGDARAPGRAGR